MYRHYRIRYRRHGAGRGSALAVTAGVVYLLAHHAGAGHVGHAGRARTVAESRSGSHAARVAVAYAESKIGDPYVWAATGPSAFDCSGLTQAAYRAAGVTIPRVSWDQWYGLPHVSRPRAGDLVLFAGGDGTRAKPGHVGIVIGPHKMVEAYAPGFPIRKSTFGLPSSPAGDEDPVGYARP